MLNFSLRLSSSLLKLFWRIALILGGAVLYSFGQMIWAFLRGDLAADESTNDSGYFDDELENMNAFTAYEKGFITKEEMRKNFPNHNFY